MAKVNVTRFICDRCGCIEECPIGENEPEAKSNLVHINLGGVGDLEICRECKISFDNWWKAGKAGPRARARQA